MASASSTLLDMAASSLWAVSIFRKTVVRIAVEPALARFGRRDDRMLRGARVLAGVAIGRAVAAERDAALLAGPQMNPRRADLHALFAFAPDIGRASCRENG